MKLLKIWIAPGPTITTNRAGRTQSTNGKTIFTGVCCAFASIACRRLIRSCAAWVRKTLAIETPKMSAWIMANAKALSSSTSVRSARCRNASDRGTPSWISWSIRANSDESTPGTLRTTCAMAALSESPASTLIVNRSSVSERVRRISFFRSSTRLFRMESGTMNPTNVSNAMHTIWRNDERETICKSSSDPTNPAIAPMILKASTRSASHPAGLPATSNFFEIRSRASSGVTRRAIRPALVTIGTNTRDPKFSLSSSSRRSTRGAAWPPAVTCDSNSRTARCRSAIVWSMNTPTSTIARKSDPIARNSQTSDIDVHDLSHPEDAEEHQDDRGPQHHEADGGGDEQPDVARVDRRHIKPDRHRQEREHPGGESALRGEHLDLPTEHRALPEGVGDRVQDLREVPADLALDVDREHRPHEVGAPDALGERRQRVLRGPAQTDLGHHALELGGGGMRDLLRHRVQRLEEAVPGAERGRQDREHVGKLVAQVLGALAERTPEHERGEGRADPRHDQREERVAEQRCTEDAEEQCRGDRGDDELARPERDPGGF